MHVGLTLPKDNRISAEIKTFANRKFEEILVEIDGFYNFEPRPLHLFSVGLGLNAAPFKEFDQFYALTIPVFN